MMVTTILMALMNYLMGGIPFGLIIGKLHGVDIRRVGSGNIGAANVGRHLGRKWGISVFVLDAAKGVVAAILSGQFVYAPSEQAASSSIPALCWLGTSLCAVLGHNYSPFLSFRGGKGVATSLGVAIGIYPDLSWAALGGFVMWMFGVGITRMSSVGSLLGAMSFPLFAIGITLLRKQSLAQQWPFVAFACLIAVFVVVRHKANITRILAGTETRLGPPNPQPSSKVVV
ncbi:MAG: glycerol-3-phosphate 1-O-acyltransferase PlsY [Planctomycetota bacterium]